MRRTIAPYFVAIGCCLLLLGIGLFASSTTVFAQDDEDSLEYIGSRECGECHGSLKNAHELTRHALTLNNVQSDKDAILGNFDEGEEIRMVQFTDESEARPFTADDVAYVLGTGRHVQAYLYEVEEGQYMVFPAEWDAVNEEWHALELAESWPADAYDFGQNCAGCHTVGLDTEAGYQWLEDGVQCESCHGPGSNHVEVVDDVGARPDPNEEIEVWLSINPATDGQACGQCHVRGIAADGVHPYPITYTPGDNLLAEDIFTPVEAGIASHWWVTGHASQPNMQFNEWMLSSHSSAMLDLQSSDMAQSECLRCHSIASDGHDLTRLLALYDPENVIYDIIEVLLDKFDIDDGDDGYLMFYSYSEAVVLDYMIMRDQGITEPTEDPDALAQEIMAFIDFDVDDIDEDDPIWEQIMPDLGEAIYDSFDDTGDPGPGAELFKRALPFVVAEVMEDEEEDVSTLLSFDSADLSTLGVNCTSCHNPHSESGNDFYINKETYALCADCHNNNTPLDGIHYPVQEMYEGQTVIEEVKGVTGAHFAAVDGPECMTCHMPSVAVDGQTRISHTFDPILPGEVVDIAELEDTCSGCHSDQLDARGIQGLIDDVQNSTGSRLETLKNTISADTPEWVTYSIAFIEGDGSRGVHNFAYTDKLLDAAEAELGLVEESAALPIQDINDAITNAQAIVDEQVQEIAGFTVPGLILLVVGVLNLLVAVAILLSRKRLLLGATALVIAIALIAVANTMRPASPALLEIAGNVDESSCVMCHNPSTSLYQLPDGNVMNLSFDMDRFVSSVHGEQMEGGPIGCVDCHGEKEIPHAGTSPASYSSYKLSMSQVCIDCHTTNLEHYLKVLDRNIQVACGDCHTPHYVRPAEELEAIDIAVPRP